jgi:DNA-binding MarR family transcriptional regulator
VRNEHQRERRTRERRTHARHGFKERSRSHAPDQYLYFLEDDHPEQRALVYVRSKTIRFKHRSPYCVDEHGCPITVKRMAADLDWDLGFTSGILKRLVNKGLIRTEHGKEPGTSRELRIFLCGEVPLPSQRKKDEQMVNQEERSVPFYKVLPNTL